MNPPEQYASEVRRFRDEIGNLDWAAIQDWMCEPQVIGGLVRRLDSQDGHRRSRIDLQMWLQWARSAGPVMAESVSRAEKWGNDACVVFHGTGLSIHEHQRRTCDSWFKLRELAPDLPWVPVLQGWHITDYWRHVDMYKERGTDLRRVPLVGLGSICRRQGTAEATRLICALSRYGLKLHGFGLKTLAWRRGAANFLASADSMAWSMEARRLPSALPGCTRHKKCNNCPTYALRWRERLLAPQPAPAQQQTEFSW